MSFPFEPLTQAEVREREMFFEKGGLETEEEHKRYAELERKRIFHIFEKNKEQATQDGWNTKKGFVLPPKGHPAQGWCATWYSLNDNSLTIPDYFTRFYN